MKKQVAILLLVTLTCVSKGLAQEPTTSVKVECGGSVESEFVEPIELHEYIIPVNAGDKLNIAVVPIGEYLETAVAIYEPAGDKIASDFERKQTPKVETEALSARGDYKVYILNYIAYGNGAQGPTILQPRPYVTSGRAGTYTILVGCTLRDGTEIPGGSSQ
jgi:hypothetical protein